jgi:hypothetical protein
MAGPRCERQKHIYLLRMEVRLLKLKSVLNACLFNSVLHCCFKDVDFDIS